MNCVAPSSLAMWIEFGTEKLQHLVGQLTFHIMQLQLPCIYFFFCIQYSHNAINLH